MSSIYAISCTPSSHRRAKAGFRVLVKTHGADERPNRRALELIAFFPVMEPEIALVLQMYRYCEICILQV